MRHMKPFFLTVSGIIMCALAVRSAEFSIPYPVIEAPVVHAGKYHILSCGDTYVVIDGSRGMSFGMIGRGDFSKRGINEKDAALKNARLKATITSGDSTIELDQAYDPDARLQIIDQGAGRVAARIFYRLCSSDGRPHGSGTTDIYLYDGRIHLAHSLHIDYEDVGTYIIKAGFIADVSGVKAEIISDGVKLMPRGNLRFIPFGADSTGFDVMVDILGRSSVKIGWKRNRYPSWLYMREIDNNPETDELYEKWPPWITQRGNSLNWVPTQNAGFTADYSETSVKKLSFLWVNGDSLEVPVGGYRALNGIMGLFLAENAYNAESLWKNHVNPAKPVVQKGEFRYYNEIEGIYEIDSLGDDVVVHCDNLTNSFDKPVFFRIWNLTGKNAYEVRENGKSVPFCLYNDGDIIDDPMVSVVKNATGPARFAGVACTVKKGSKSSITMTKKTGLQFTYQMYSDLETYEAWSDACTDKPLFMFHKNRGELHHVTLPGKDEYAIFKLPLFWLKNGVNSNTFMNRPRGFVIDTNGPDRIAFTFTSVNLQATGLSKYQVEVPYLPDRVTFDIIAEFAALDDGKRWTSIEYCDLYPFDNVYRRTFHYDDVIFLTKDGVFDRVGTGAWGGRFETIEEPEYLGYYARSVTREGEGSRCPDSDDGTVWILGTNPERGNILYRRGEWTPSKDARSVFSLCNAWVDIHNTISGRSEPASPEIIGYTVEVFGGPVPSLDNLNVMYKKAAGGEVVKQVTGVKYGDEGEILGFVVKK
ncbi:MAG TPA: hypothetical protein ENH82_08980 [bacterium]|nr:hypothetical protein [bacterium]